MLLGLIVSVVALDIVLLIRDGEEKNFHWLVADAAAQFLWIWALVHFLKNIGGKFGGKMLWIIFYATIGITTITNAAVMVVCIVSFEADRKAEALARAALTQLFFVTDVVWLFILSRAG